MTNYSVQINKVKKEFGLIQKENFKPALDGTHYKVFVSNRYVIRFRDDNPKLLMREARFLKPLNHVLIPDVLWAGKVDTSTAMVENRLPGKTINLVWKTLSKDKQRSIVRQVVAFIKYLKTQTKQTVYSVNSGKKYTTFYDYLTDGVSWKAVKIKKCKQATGILKEVLAIIKKPETKKLLLKPNKITLNHGDLIIHNLLTDGRNLTGVLDWELALFGDCDYDLWRLFYYQECASAYREQGIDETFEADYMDKLVAAILKSNLIENKKLFFKKYKIVRAFFFLNALYWAVNSENPEKNSNELVVSWNKKSGGWVA